MLHAGQTVGLSPWTRRQFRPPLLSGLAVWARGNDPSGVVYDSGTDADLRRVATLPSRGDLGGSLGRVGSTDRPVNALFPGPVSRPSASMPALFFDGDDYVEFQTGALSDFTFMHDGQGMTACGVFRLAELPTDVGNPAAILATKPSSGNATGFTLYVSGASNRLIVKVSNGSSEVASTLSGSALVANADYRFIARFDGSNGIDVIVNAVNFGTDPIGASPSVSDPTSALSIGRSGDEPRAYIPEVFVYRRRITDAERSVVDAYLAAEWTLSLTYDQLATSSVASLYALDAFLRSSGSAWVDRLGNYAVTEVGAPSHNTSGDFAFKNVMALDGLADYAHIDAAAAQFSGNDTAFSVITALKLDAITDHSVFSLGGPGDARHLFRAVSGNWNVARNDGGSSTQFASAGTSNTTATVLGHAFRPTEGAGTVSLYEDYVDSELAALELPSATFDKASTGVYRYNASVERYADGQFAAQLWFARYLNTGEYLAIRHALAAEFGL